MFTGPVNLQTLDLSYNSISELSANLLKHLPSLKHIRYDKSMLYCTIKLISTFITPSSTPVEGRLQYLQLSCVAQYQLLVS